MKTINIVKIGSDSVTQENIKKLLKDIEKWEEKTGEKFLIISSGSVKLGKERLGNGSYKSKGLYASVGQKILMNIYGKYTKKILSQILLDDYISKEYIEDMLEKFL
jgi:glutamate 5-kinase